MKNLISFLSVLALVILAACTSTRSYQNNLDFVYNWNKDFALIKDSKLYEPKIKEEINYFEENKYIKNNVQDIFLKSKELMLSYSRLYVLEDKKGSTSKADIYYQKARYWYLIMLECSGNDGPNKIEKELEKFTKKDVRKSILYLNPQFVKNIKYLSNANKKTK